MEKTTKVSALYVHVFGIKYTFKLTLNVFLDTSNLYTSDPSLPSNYNQVVSSSLSICLDSSTNNQVQEDTSIFSSNVFRSRSPSPEIQPNGNVINSTQIHRSPNSRNTEHQVGREIQCRGRGQDGLQSRKQNRGCGRSRDQGRRQGCCQGQG